jgi:ribosome-binding ATPase
LVISAAREFLDSGEDIPDWNDMRGTSVERGGTQNEDTREVNPESPAVGSTLLKQASPERIQQCNIEGLEIAEALLGRAQQSALSTSAENVEPAPDRAPMLSGKGGSWTYTIGLVGKPSAGKALCWIMMTLGRHVFWPIRRNVVIPGKSTFFNTASAFARQRDDADNVIGGATMAPHPFTTIDPNIGFCLVPAPPGACPEDEAEESILSKFHVGSSHGKDSQGRRLLPVLLKDVAGLVPGAYQGRGRGNKFLNDLTDADVLVHVVDSSGMADAEGNLLGEEEVMDTSKNSSRPLEDLAWIRNELIEWVYNNLMYKWDSVIRRGRSKVGAISFFGIASSSLLNSNYNPAACFSW